MLSVIDRKASSNDSNSPDWTASLACNLNSRKIPSLVRSNVLPLADNLAC